MTRIILLLALLLAAPALTVFETQAQSGRSLVSFPKSTLKIESGGKSFEFSVELARTHRQQMQGLMFRRRMAPDAGMLFVYKREEPTAMWMKNTFLPLDILFIGRDGVIRKIAERTVPMSEETISSDGPAAAVLELNAGTASRLGIKVGDRVRSAVLGTVR